MLILNAGEDEWCLCEIILRIDEYIVEYEEITDRCVAVESSEMQRIPPFIRDSPIQIWQQIALTPLEYFYDLLAEVQLAGLLKVPLSPTLPFPEEITSAACEEARRLLPPDAPIA